MTNLTYRSPKAEVRPSPIQGLGLFLQRKYRGYFAWHLQRRIESVHRQVHRQGLPAVDEPNHRIRPVD